MYSQGHEVVASVDSIFPFGIFVHLSEGTRAYIRRRELTLSGDTDPRDVVTEGQQIRAVVSQEASPGRIMELSVRAILPDPWQEFARQFQTGNVVTATVKSVFPDRVFVQIRPGVDGLILKEELAAWKVDRSDDMVWSGDRVEAVITYFDVPSKRVRLSIRRRLEQLAQAETIAQYLYQKARALGALEEGVETATIALEPIEIGLASPILVVEDHEAVREPLVEWLSRRKCLAQGAETATEALVLCQAQNYGLVIVDLGMPDMDGLSFIQKLRQTGFSNPLVVMSSPELIAQQLPSLQSSGVAAVFAKPLDLNEIRHFLLQLASGEKVAVFDINVQATPIEVQPFQSLVIAMRSSQLVTERFSQGLDQLIRETRAEVGVVFHLDSVSRKVSIVATAGDISLDTEAVYSLLDSPVKNVILEERIVWENRVSSERTGKFRKLLELLPFESCIGVPLKAGKQTEHALFVFHRQPGSFSRYRLRDVLAVASLFSVALESQILDDRIQSLSRIFLTGQLAAGFGHEVYNRISGLELQFQNVRSDVRRLSRAGSELAAGTRFQEIEHALDQALETSTDLKRIVEEFQRLIRTGEEQGVDVNQVLHRAEALVRPLARRARVDIQLKPAADLPLAAGNSIHLQQVLLNLMLNAVQHMSNQASGRRLLAVTTTCEESDDIRWVGIRVSDTGPGIHQQLWDKIFALGFTTRAGGSGLGLYIARSLVESMGGRLTVEESLILLGTTFLVKLPAIIKEPRGVGNNERRAIAHLAA